MVMNSILQKINLTTTQTIMVVALSVGLGAGVFTAAISDSKPHVTTIKTTSSDTPITTKGPSVELTPGTTTNPVSAPSSDTTAPAASAPVTQPLDTTTTASPAPTATPVPVTIVKSQFQGDNTAGVCVLEYSDGTTGRVPAVLTTKDVAWNVTMTSNNCESLVGTNQ